MSDDKIFAGAFFGYWLCVACMWAYLIAWAWSSRETDAGLSFVAITLGWMPALVWPMIILVAVMKFLFFGGDGE